MVWPAALRLVACLALTIGFGAAAARAGAAGTVAPLSVSELAPGVFVHIGEVAEWGAAHEDVANLAFVVGTRCVAVIDSGGSVDIGRRWRATIEARTAVPICQVINTHVHPDHVLGNLAFADLQPRPAFIGHPRLAAALAARGPYYLKALQREGATTDATMLVAPTQTVDGTLDLDLGGRVLSLCTWPTAHTDDDLTAFDRATRTLFASDLLFVTHLPVIDGSLRGWLKVMEELRGLDVAQVVPGHGASSHDWPRVLEPQRHYLDHVLDETRAAIRRGETLRQAVEVIGPDPQGDWQLVSAYHRRNLTTAYAELEWE